jgi:hypothetical protein
MLGGLMFIESLNALSWREDWSRVRSPGRAARRLKSGKRKHAIPKVCEPAAYRMGDRLIVHPAIAAAVRERLKGNKLGAGDG